MRKPTQQLEKPVYQALKQNAPPRLDVCPGRGRMLPREMRVGKAPATTCVNALRLSVLDFDPTLTRASDLAPAAEALGYHRYWLGDHPPQANAELLAAIVAGLTTDIRVGTGGVVLRVRNVLQSASNFLFLTKAYGARIDAGICGGGAHSAIVSEALGQTPNEDDFAARARGWTSLLEATAAPDPLSEHRDMFGGPPEMWTMGTGPKSGVLAAELGMSYAYSIFHHFSVESPSAMNAYRARFRPSSLLPAPRTMLAVAGICGASDAEARAQIEHAPRWLMPVKSAVVGSVATCRAHLQRLRAIFETDDIMILEQSLSTEGSIRSLELFAEAAQGC